MGPVTWCAKPDAELSFADFVRFYATEYDWGRECVSVRIGKRLTINEYPELHAITPRRGVSAAELQRSIRIEDPFEAARDLADVLGPGRSVELHEALLAEHAAMAGFRHSEAIFVMPNTNLGPRSLSRLIWLLLQRLPRKTCKPRTR